MNDAFLSPYVPVAILFAVALFFALVIPFLAGILGPQRPTARKAQAYESGITPIGEAQRRLPVRFYKIAVLFILFDVDIILLVPWAITFRELGLFGLYAMLVFIVIFILGDAWVWKKGVLEWE